VSIVTALAIYFVVWWIALFVVLPWGVHSQHESGEVAPGTDPGAPSLPNIKRKLVWTTIVATIAFGAWCILYVNHLMPVDRIGRWLGVP
jgi:predicted secreted protein